MLAVATIAVGCVPLSGGWDVASLRERHPDVMRRAGQRLGDTPPYFMLHRDSAILFLCRFSTQTPIRVSLPGGVTKSERSAIRVALHGWENAGLGLRFSEVAEESAMIEIHFAEPPTDSKAVVVAVVGTGYTVSDCGFRPDRAGLAEWDADAKSHAPLPAQLTGAIVHLRRSNTDMLGREIMLNVDELVGVALHELGHALGFPGHVATPDSVMTKTTDTVRRFGRRAERNRGRKRAAGRGCDGRLRCRKGSRGKQELARSVHPRGREQRESQLAQRWSRGGEPRSS